MPALSPGARLGAYEVIDLLGAGGMGEVYRAQDTKLGRDVALKILSEAFADDLDRLTRFKREAKALAALNHPHIAALFGMEEADGRHFLIMELVDGETLADRLSRGPMAVDGVLRAARQIAEALEAAHEKGIVHRDLKPANVKISADEKVKVLDFGLAKLGAGDASGASSGPTAAALTHSPTLSMMATQAGVILGTAAYMSPEQAQGMPADQRSDVFSFGSVLYEMLTGRQAFRGDSAPAILAAVLIGAPDLSAIPANLNARLIDLVRRCLEKNPKQRWQAVGDLRMELEAIAAAPHASASAGIVAPPAPLWKRMIPVAAGVVVTAAVTSAAWWRARPAAPPPLIVTRFTLPLADGTQFTNFGRNVVGISPDGTNVVVAANVRLYLRSMADPTARSIPGSEGSASGVANPVFSPDGRWIVFYSVGDRALKKIAVAGGAAVTLCPAGNPFGMTWDASGILFGQATGPATTTTGILRVSPNGGKPDRLIVVKDDEVADDPQMLPDGDTVLFTLAKGPSGRLADAWDKAQIVAQSLRTGRRTTIIEGGSGARYVSSGHILYAIGGVLYAVPFDAGKLRVDGGQVPVLEGVARASQTGSAHWSLSDNGSLIYLPGPSTTSTGDGVVALSDRKGTIEGLKIAPGAYEAPRVSPDGKWIAVGDTDATNANIWVYELAGTSARRRLTFGGKNRYPVWSSDSRRVIYQSDREGDTGLFWQLADGTGTPERLTKADPDTAHIPDSFSPVADQLLFSTTKGSTSSLRLLSLKTREITSFGGVESVDLPGGAFSPDGRWVAYTVREGTAPAIYVQPFPATGTKYQIVPSAIHPVWTRDGREIIGMTRGRPVAVGVTTQPRFELRSSVELQRTFGDGGAITVRNFDIMPDGQHLLTVPFAGAQLRANTTPQFQVVLNWIEELKQRVPK
jgi:eukaryotic-like serine/threonine-protein kinase